MNPRLTSAMLTKILLMMVEHPTRFTMQEKMAVTGERDALRREERATRRRVSRLTKKQMEKRSNVS